MPLKHFAFTSAASSWACKWAAMFSCTAARSSAARWSSHAAIWAATVTARFASDFFFLFRFLTSGVVSLAFETQGELANMVVLVLTLSLEL